MARPATKSCGNVWYEARKNAEKWDSRMKSREGAAFVLGMSESAISDAELGYGKVMPPEKAEVMALGYRAPNLIGHFCKQECPLGCYVDVSDVVPDVSEAVVRLVKDVEVANNLVNELVDIAYDGTVSDEEYKKFNSIMESLGKIAVSISSIRNLGMRIKMFKEGCV